MLTKNDTLEWFTKCWCNKLYSTFKINSKLCINKLFWYCSYHAKVDQLWFFQNQKFLNWYIFLLFHKLFLERITACKRINYQENGRAYMSRCNFRTLPSEFVPQYRLPLIWPLYRTFVKVQVLQLILFPIKNRLWIWKENQELLLGFTHYQIFFS